MIAASLQPEFSLLVQCCRWNFTKADLEPRPAVPAQLDWVRFVQLASRHRVQGLAWNALAHHADDELPQQAKEALSSAARSIAATNLGIAAQCRQLRETFERARVPLLFVKGLTVGALGYRSPLLKMSWDIDLLIDPSDLAKAAELLVRQGCELRLPSGSAQLQTWHQRSKESVWQRESLHIELHTRLADNLRLIPAINVHSPRQHVEIAPMVVLPTLAEEELFAYLAVHGASSAWFRIKWISDFAALLHDRSGTEIEHLYQRSQELGAARAAGQALLLADWLFNLMYRCPRLREQLASDRAIRRLSRVAMRMMSDGVREPTERPLGTLPIHQMQVFLQPGLDYKISELSRQIAGLVMR